MHDGALKAGSNLTDTICSASEPLSAFFLSVTSQSVAAADGQRCWMISTGVCGTPDETFAFYVTS